MMVNGYSPYIFVIFIYNIYLYIIIYIYVYYIYLYVHIWISIYYKLIAVRHTQLDSPSDPVGFSQVQVKLSDSLEKAHFFLGEICGSIGGSPMAGWLKIRENQPWKTLFKLMI